MFPTRQLPLVQAEEKDRDKGSRHITSPDKQKDEPWREELVVGYSDNRHSQLA